MKKICKKMAKDPIYFGATVLRLAFAFLFIFVAVKKLRMGYGGFADSLVNNAESLLAQEIPTVFLYAYGWIIPALELVAGLALLFNKYTAYAYQAIAFVYITFIIGQQYDGNTSKIGTEYLPSLTALFLAYYLHWKQHHHEK